MSNPSPRLQTAPPHLRCFHQRAASRQRWGLGIAALVLVLALAWPEPVAARTRKPRIDRRADREVTIRPPRPAARPLPPSPAPPPAIAPAPNSSTPGDDVRSPD